MLLNDRIAICFSGQSRCVVENSESILRYIGDYRDRVDIFIHTWNIETESRYSEKNHNRPGIEKIRRNVDPEIFKKLAAIYRPLDMRVDNFDTFQILHHYRAYSRRLAPLIYNKPTQIPMFQSILESNQLKLSHETLCGSKYKMVMRMRTDLNFDPNTYQRTLKEDIDFSKDDTFYVFDWWNKLSLESKSVEDMCWLSNSQLMDIVCSKFSIELETKIWPDDGPADWQYRLYLFLVQNGIKVSPFKNNVGTLMRSEFVTDSEYASFISSTSPQ